MTLLPSIPIMKAFEYFVVLASLAATISCRSMTSNSDDRAEFVCEDFKNRPPFSDVRLALINCLYVRSSKYRENTNICTMYRMK
eukprot:TCALIF_10512-PA protein Name:"Protein of unknown function" AED:0.21 eAED:0.21 QI:14/1/0/1/0/0.5/2/0/83